MNSVVASRYRLLRVVGRGGMAVVYEAEDLAARGARVALKMLDDDVRRDPEAVARFAREAYAIRDMPSLFLANVRDDGHAENGTPYLAMDLLEGHDLGAVLRDRGALPWDEAVGYVVQACAGIAAAHDAGIIHRDLKPSNLFLEHDEETVRVRVLDFGLSRHDRAGGELTSPFGVLGTAGFMSPEQLRDPRSVDPRSDVWALGIILYRAIVGAMPFRGATGAVVARVLDPEPLPRIARLDVPRALVHVVARALDKNPKGRPPDARAFALALAPFAAPSPAVADALAEIDRSTPSVVLDEGALPDDSAPAVDASRSAAALGGLERERLLTSAFVGAGFTMFVLTLLLLLRP